MKENSDHKTKRAPTASFMTGVVALVFLAVGYQTALFIHSASVERVVAGRDHPDTVFVYGPDGRLAHWNGNDSHSREGQPGARASGSRYSSTGTVALPASGYSYQPQRQSYSSPAGSRSGYSGRSDVGNVLDIHDSVNSVGDEARDGVAARDDGFKLMESNTGGQESGGESASENGRQQGKVYVRKNASHSDEVMAMRAANPPRPAELFDFDPNTVSLDDLVRLGFSAKQAASIVNYRNKGGRFRRKSDFARSFVVSEDMFARLEPYIAIPKLDLNRADSAALDALPGIGPYFVKKIIAHREELQGYSYVGQLLDIYHFDQEKYDALSDLVTAGPVAPYPIWTLPADSLRRHPYIGTYSANGIVLYRKHHPKSQWTIDGLAQAGVLRPENVSKLQRCHLAAP